MANSRIKYANSYLEFDRQLNTFESTDTQVRDEFTSMSGTKEFLNYHTKRRIRIGREFGSPGDVTGLRSFFEFAKDGSEFSFERDPDLGTYINFDGEVRANDGLDYTYVGTSHNYHANNIDQSPANAILSSADDTKPRFVSDPQENFKKGMFVEGSGTNHLLRSEEFDVSPWGLQTGATVAANYASIPAPDGTFTADNVTAPNVSSGLLQTTSTAVTFDGSGSIYVYALDVMIIRVVIASSTTGNLVVEDVSIAPSAGWQRIAASYTGGTAGNFNYFVLSLTAGVNFLLWGAQLETNYTPSSYIQSVSAKGSRAGEYLEIPLSIDYFDKSTQDPTGAMSNNFSFWAFPLWGGNDTAQNSTFFQVLDSTHLKPFIEFASFGSTTYNIFGYDDTGVTAKVNEIQSASYTGAMTHYFIQISHSPNGAKRIAKIYVNGTLLSGTGSGTFSDYSPIYQPDRLIIGNKETAANTANMIISEFTSYKDREFTETEIQELADKTKQLGYCANRYEGLTLINDSFVDDARPGIASRPFELEFEKIT